MVMQQHSIKHNFFLQENEHLGSIEAYPVDLSLFLDISQEASVPRDCFSVLSARYDPIGIVLYALLWWNNYLQAGTSSRERLF